MGILRLTRATALGLALGVIASCNGGSGNGGSSSTGEEGSLTAANTPDYLTQNETADIIITKSHDAPLAITVSEFELDLSIVSSLCSPPDTLCEQWSVTPASDAQPAEYRIGIDYLNPNIRGSDSFGFTLLPAVSAPAAIRVIAGDSADAIITKDGQVWGVLDSRALKSPDIPDIAGFERGINQPFRTGLGNARDVAFVGDISFYVLNTDGSATYYRDSTSRGVPVVDESDQPVTNLSQVAAEYALLYNGRVHYLYSGVLSYESWSPDRNYAGDYFNGLPRNVAQIALSRKGDINLFLSLHDDGTVWQKGRRSGINSGFSSSWPSPTLLTNMTQVAAGYATWSATEGMEHFGAALRNDGTVWVWVPYSDTTLAEGFPRQVTGLANVIDIAVEGPTLLARDSAGDVWQVEVDTIGNGNFTYKRTATRVPGISNARAMTVGEHRALAVLSDCNGGGTVRSWSLSPGRQALGDGVRTGDFNRPVFTPTPVIGIGDAEPSCPRKVLFYKSGNTKGSDITVSSDSGNMVCDDYLCWESVRNIVLSSNRAIRIASRNPGVDATPHWDCEGQGNSFTLRVGASDVYCKLTTAALRLSVNQQTTYNLSESSRSYRYDALGHTVTSIPAGLFSLPGDQAEAHTVLPPGTTLQLVATPAPGYTFSGWEGAGCGSDGNVTMSDRNIECQANFVEVTTPSPNNGNYTLTLTIEGGPGAGEVYSLPAPPDFQCINSAEATTVCTHSYADGTPVSLLGQAYGATTLSWSGCDRANTDGCLVNMNADRQVTATFSP